MPNESPVLTSADASIVSPEQGPLHRPSRRSRWKLFLGLGVLFVGAFFLFCKWPPSYAGTAVCQECGIRRDSFDWQSRFGHFTLHHFTTESPTFVSRALAARQSPPPHRHAWAAPVLPVIANGNAEPPLNLLYAVEAPRVARFAEGLALNANEQVLTKWRRMILDPRYSVVLDPALRFMRFPADGFSDPAAFLSWWRRSEFPLWNRLREVTEPD